MPAFVISEAEIVDETIATKYRAIAAASIAEYGGRYLVRGADPEIVEGPPTSKRIVIVEFPSLQKAREWYTSDSYAGALRLRGEALDRRLMFVDGIVTG